MPPVWLPPSPKVQAYETMVPSLSSEPAALKLTVSGAVPDVGVAASTAVGGCEAVACVVTLNVYWPTLP